jgi:hypothetical protein
MNNDNDSGATMNANDRNDFYADNAIWDHEYCDPSDCTMDENCFAVDPGADDRD